MNQSWILPVVIVAIVILLALVACACLMGAFGALAYLVNEDITGYPSFTEELEQDPTSTPVVVRPTDLAKPKGDLTPDSTHTPIVISGQPSDTLKVLNETDIPINDLRDLAQRLEGKRGIPLTLEPPSGPLKIGDSMSFWVSNADTNENFKVSAVLRYITDHAYFWIQDDLTYDEEDLEKLGDTFEEEIYPTNREFFGSEWIPGVDSDPHIYILYTEGIGSTVAGYFSSGDEYHPQIQEYSNGHEMFIFSADSVSLDEEYTYAVLAHEFQHMIHWYRDRNETTWMNEGFSDLAAFLNGYGIGGHDSLYARNPDLQLNDWPTDHTMTMPHYGAAFLFMAYFLDRFGEEATQALVAEPLNGMESIDQVLRSMEATDPLSGGIIGADDVVIDWFLAFFLQDKRLGDGRYALKNYPGAPRPRATETLRACTSDFNTRDVHQYGVDYIRLDCRQDVTLHFEGSTQVNVLPTQFHSGSFAFWSNKGDESDMTLTRAFDFRQTSGPLTLTYWTWFDIEEDFDYVYLEASTNGEDWYLLTTPSGTAENPTGANYGWGYNGQSQGDQGTPGWIQESIDLSEFAGQEVQLRFEYITDAAVNGEGFVLDDVAIPEIGYFTDFENGAGGWEADGFVRIQNVLPQTFRLALITKDGGTKVQYLSLAADNAIDIRLDFDQLDEAILVVTGTTRFTRQHATYRFNFSP